MLHDGGRFTLRPRPRYRYDRSAIYRDGMKTGMSCEVEIVVRECGGWNIAWKPNPAGRIQGYPAREDDQVIEFALPPSQQEQALAVAIMNQLLGPRGLDVERID